MCGGGSQTVTQKTELDPVLQAHLYGGELPASALTGIMPVYFQPGGSLASQAENVQGAYDAMLTPPPPPPPPARSTGDDRGNDNDNMQTRGRVSGVGNDFVSTVGSYLPGGVNTRNPGSAFNEAAANIRNTIAGDRQPTQYDVPIQNPRYKDGGEVQTFQEGGSVFETDGTVPLSLAEQVYQLSVGTDLGAMLPEYQIAERTAAQQQAAELARAGIGQYEGALKKGTAAAGKGIEGLRSAISQAESAASGARGDVRSALSDLSRAAAASRGAVQEAMPYREAAIDVLTEAGVLGAGATERYDPTTGYKEFMDPYLEDVVRQVEQDIARQGMMQEDVLRGQAAQAGAFGGSRAAVAERELGRNVAEQQARMATQLRSDAYRQAQQQAQQAFESQQARQAQIAGLYGQLGQATGAIGSQFGQLALQGTGQELQAAGQAGQLGLGLGQLGVSAAGQAAQAAQGIGQLGYQQAQIGQMGAQMRQQDINTMLQIGAQEQAQQQAALDAARMNEYQRIMAPFQQTAFRADILSGSPTGIASTMTQPGASPVSQLAGLGLAAYGLRGAFS